MPSRPFRSLRRTNRKWVSKRLIQARGLDLRRFTLRTYTHLLPSSETRTRKAIDDAFTEAEAEAEAEGNGDPPAAQGTSVPPAKPMCPQRALAA